MTSKKTDAAAAPEKAKDDWSVIDPLNVLVTYKPGKRCDVVFKDEPGRPLAFSTPPGILMYPHTIGDGSLGEVITTKTGKKICEQKRPKSRFSVSYGIGDMDDDAIRHLKPFQRKTMVKLYEIGRNVLGSVFDQRLPDFLAPIEKAETAAIDAEADAQQRMGGQINTAYAVNQAKTTDKALQARLDAAAREKFIAGAKMFPNPAHFDENGQRRRADGKTERLFVTAKRNVWARKPGYDNIPTDEMPQGPSYKDRSLAGGIANWPVILREMDVAWTWNPFQYSQPDPVTKKNKIIPHQTITVPDGPGGPPVTVLDPNWSPISDKKQTLGCLKFGFNVYNSEYGYGVKLVPRTEIVIVRQRPVVRNTIDVSEFADIATGAIADDSDQETPRDDGDEADIEQAKKKIKTEQDIADIVVGDDAGPTAGDIDE